MGLFASLIRCLLPRDRTRHSLALDAAPFSPQRLECRRLLDASAAGLLLAPLSDPGEYVQVGENDEPLSGTPESSAAVGNSQSDTPPSNIQFAPVTMIDENNFAQLQLTFDDPDTFDTHTVEVDWGDGTTTTIELEGGERFVGTNHQYLDDNPSVTPQDEFTITVTVTDNDGGMTTGETTALVNNVVPSNIQFAPVVMIDENDFAQLQLTFDDPGSIDTHTVEIDWGDGTTTTIELEGGERFVGTNHQYLDDNPSVTSQDEYTITVQVTDDDGGMATGETTVLVKNVAPEQLILTLTPNAGNALPPPASSGGSGLIAPAASSAPVSLDLLEGSDNPEQELLAALLTPGSGISVVAGSERFVGRVGDGDDPNLAQSATFSSLLLTPSDGSLPVIDFDGGGVFLTSGVANIPFSNTSTNFGSGSVGVSAPNEGVAADTADLQDILVAAGLVTTTNNVNLLEFEFTVLAGTTSVEVELVFGSDEFPDQSVTDIFAFIVDGKNFAVFPDGSLVSFVQGQNAANFNDNGAGAYEIEYDGISNVMRVVGLLDATIPEGGTHTLKIAIANTSDDVFDSGVFIGKLQAGTAVDGGIVLPPSTGTGSIVGVKFEDLNLNGVRDAGEPGLAGVTIYLDTNNNGVLDDGDISTITLDDNLATSVDETGTYSFTGLAEGTFVVREIVSAGFEQTSPAISTIVDPSGVNNPTSGDVSPSLIDLTLATGQVASETVSITLPTSGGAFSMVDVFLLFDDTGSFSGTAPTISAEFQSIISELESSLPGVDFGFGVGRFEDFGGPFSGVSFESASGRPFILNQPIVTSDTVGFSDAINAALSRSAPGGGGDLPETLLEALFQVATGAGFDGNGNGSLLDSGVAGLASTQTNPGNSGDVPPFSSFTFDAANNVLSPAGTVGGAGFRPGALPIILVASDIGTVFRADSIDPIVGASGVTVPLSAFLPGSRQSTPDSDGDGIEDGASIQQTITALNNLGALVLGLGTNDSPDFDPRIVMEAIATLTGAINGSETSIDSNIPGDAIDPGDPFYFQINTGVSGNVADGIVSAIQSAVTSVTFDIEVRSSDPAVAFSNSTGILTGIGEGDTATFNVDFTGTGNTHRFDLQFVRAGTDVQLGSIPVEISTIVFTPRSQVVEVSNGESVTEVDFGNRRLAAGSADLMIFENEVVDLDISFFDVGTLDTHTVEVNWGDGTIETIGPLSAGEFETAISHRYLDDDPTVTTQDVYTITVKVTDDDGGMTSSEATVLVKNVAPVIETLMVTPSIISEGNSVTVSGTFSDVGTLDSHTATIRWGDGSFESITMLESADGSGIFTISHTYADNDTVNPDDGPVPDNLYTITVTITDDDNGVGASPIDVTVLNVSPGLEPIIEVTGVNADGEATLTIRFTDPGADTLTVFVDWGDVRDPNDPAIPALQPFVIELTVPDLETPGTFTRTLFHKYDGPPNPLDPAAPIEIFVFVGDDDLGEEFVQEDGMSQIRMVTIGNPGVIVDPVPVVTSPAQAPVLFARQVTSDLFFEPISTVEEALRGAGFGATGGDPNATSDRFFELRVLDSLDDPVERYRLKNEVLEDLPALFRSLPDNHYAIYLVHVETRTSRLVLEFYVRNGKVIDPGDDSEGTRDRPPTEEAANQPADARKLEAEQEGAGENAAPAAPVPALPEDATSRLDRPAVDAATLSENRRADPSGAHLSLGPVVAGLAATSSFGSWAKRVDRTVASAGPRQWQRLRLRHRQKRKNR